MKWLEYKRALHLRDFCFAKLREGFLLRKSKRDFLLRKKGFFTAENVSKGGCAEECPLTPPRRGT